MAVEAILNVHQLLEVILKHNITYKWWGDALGLRRKKQQLENEIGSYPLLHDIISMVGYLLHDAEGSYVEKTFERKQINSFCTVHRQKRQ